MADIFEVKGVNAELKVMGKSYRFADPQFAEKVLLRKEFKELAKKKDQMDEEDYVLSAYALNKKLIKQFLPTIEDETLNTMGDFAIQALTEEINNLAEQKFGAVVEKTTTK